MIVPTMTTEIVAPASGTSDRTRTDPQDFLQLFLTQITNQDPLKPLDNSEMMQQMASLQQLEQFEGLEQSLARLNRTLSLSAGSLVSHLVEVLPPEGGNPIQ